jgi:hypothetical protein
MGLHGIAGFCLEGHYYGRDEASESESYIRILKIDSCLETGPQNLLAASRNFARTCGLSFSSEGLQRCGLTSLSFFLMPI